MQKHHLPLCVTSDRCDLLLSCRPADEEQKQHTGHNRLTDDTRQLAVIACAKVWVDDKLVYAEAVRVYEKLPRTYHPDADKTISGPAIKRLWQNFLQNRNLKDAPRSGRPVKISREDALAASELLKKGKTLVRQLKGGAITYIVYFTTVNEAIRLVPELKAILDKYDVTPHQLYLAMKREDPYLERRSVVLKPGFTDQQKQGRKAWCVVIRARMGDSIALQTAWMEGLVQCDEGKVTYSTKAKQHVRVYHDSREPMLHDYVCLPKVLGEQELAAHFVVCVSPHPAFMETNGLVYFEFTTGTSFIRRLHNTLDQTTEEAFDYVVSTLTYGFARCEMHRPQRRCCCSARLAAHTCAQLHLPSNLL